MATKKGSKSSKTAHVLNVLSGPKQDSAAEEDVKPVSAEETVATNKQDAEPARPLVRAPILEMARANDDALSEQIHELLEEGWADEIEEPIIIEATSAPIVHEEVPPQLLVPSTGLAAPLKEEEPVQPSHDQVRTIDQETSALPITQEAPSNAPEKEEEDFCHVNVMQALVDERCMRYIRMFGLCDCSRCIADVKALALTSLPPKYLVMRKGEVIPMLTVYESRFNTAVVAQLISACKVVMDYPRH